MCAMKLNNNYQTHRDIKQDQMIHELMRILPKLVTHLSHNSLFSFHVNRLGYVRDSPAILF